jgi:hypothetical protein
MTSKTLRNCSRCGKELSDFASLECGVGPSCRGKNNDIFAKQIPADVASCSAIILSLTKEQFHVDIAEQFDSIKNEFLTKIQRASQNNYGHGLILSGSDFRKIVGWFDMSLSFPTNNNTKTLVTKLIQALGYQRLAGVLRGDVCMSPAKITIQDGMLVLDAKNNKMGYFAMKKVPGVILPRYRGLAYKAPVSSYKQFLDTVERHWPFNDIGPDLEAKIADINKSSTAKATENIVDEKIINDNRPVATITRNSGIGFTVLTPWCGTNQEMFSMLNQFKLISSSERKYDAVNCSWSFKDNHFIAIKELVGLRYRIIEKINNETK